MFLNKKFDMLINSVIPRMLYVMRTNRLQNYLKYFNYEIVVLSFIMNLTFFVFILSRVRFKANCIYLPVSCLFYACLSLATVMI